MSCLSGRPLSKNPKRFTEEEDALLTRCVGNSETPDWRYIASKFHDRTARQVRERWNLYLSPTINLGPWSDDEDKFLIEKINEVGLKWSVLHEFFEGRTQMSIKNRWNTHLRKRVVMDNSGKIVLKKNLTSEKKQIRITKQVTRQQMAFDILYQVESKRSLINSQPIPPENFFGGEMNGCIYPILDTFENDALFCFSPDSIFLN